MINICLFRKWLCLSVFLTGLGVLSPHAQMASQQAQMGQQSPPQRSREHSPIAISVLPSGLISVLGSRGGLFLVTPANSQQTQLKTSMGNFTPLDMTSARIGNEDFLFVTMYWAFSTQSSQGNEGVIVQYSLQGQEVKKWTAIGHTFAGIAADSARGTIYLGSPNNGDISTLNIGEQIPKTAVHVNGASLIGALALDADGQRLFVVVLGSSNIYVVDLARRRSRLLASGLGVPDALSFDPSTHQLY